MRPLGLPLRITAAFVWPLPVSVLSGILFFRRSRPRLLLLLLLSRTCALLLLLLFLPFPLSPERLRLELVPLAANVSEPAQSLSLVTEIATSRKHEIESKTYSIACLGAGSSVVKYGCCSTSAAVGRFAGS